PLVLLNKIHRGDHAPPTAKNPRTPPYLERAIERCLRVDPGERFQSGEALAAALEAGVRRGGLSEIDRQNARDLPDPAAPHNAAAEPRILATSIAQARAASARGEVARALALCGRVLAWRPSDEAALALIRRLERRGRARRAGLALGAALLVAVAGAFGHRAA